MADETLKHFRYEIALGAAIPMPKPPLDYYPQAQYSVQQFLLMLCKEQIGALGKKGKTWSFGPEAPDSVRLSSRPDIMELLDYAEEIRIIEPKPGAEAGSGDEGAFVPYQLSQAYWDKFGKFA